MTYYHLADEVNFRLDPDFRPQNNTTMGGDYRPGIFVSGDPYGVSHWCQMYGYWRPWVVEFEGSVRGVEGGYGNEVFIPAEHFDKLRVSRVVPLDAFCRELYQDWGWTEGYYETTFDTEEPIPSHPGGWGHLETPRWKGSYRYPGDARSTSSSWRSQYEARIRRYRGDVGGIVSKNRTAGIYTYYHNTSNPAFVPDPGYEPNKMYLDAPEGPGIYVTDNKEDWTRFNSGYAIQTPGLRATFTTDKPLQDYPGVVYSPGGIGQTQYWVPAEVMPELNYQGLHEITSSRTAENRTAAEPGGVLPWNPSHRGYTWITHSDGTLEAVTNDGVNRMFLHEYPYGWEWEVYDSLGFVEGGTFGMGLKGGDALRQRANELLAEFDTRAEMRTRGPSRGYQDDYTPAPNTLWSKREAWSNSPWADYDFENPTYAPYGPMTLYRGFSFEANPGVADQLLERLKSGEPVVKVFEDALIESRYSAMQFGDKVGVYWSTDKDYALNLAMVDSFLDDHVGLYIQAHWEGGDHDINFGESDRKNYWGNESEVRLLPGTEVKGLEVGIYVGGRWHTSGTGQSFTAERTSPSSARPTTSERYAERLRREGRR